MFAQWKRKRNDGDPVTVFIEGKDSKDWIAVDMGKFKPFLCDGLLQIWLRFNVFSCEYSV